MIVLVCFVGYVKQVNSAPVQKKGNSLAGIPVEEREIIEYLDQTALFQEAHQRLLELESKRPLHRNTYFVVGVTASRSGLYSVACYYLLGVFESDNEEDDLAKNAKQELVYCSRKLQGWKDHNNKPDGFLMLWEARILLGQQEHQACLDRLQQYQKLMKESGVDSLPLNVNALAAEAHFGLKNFEGASRCLSEIKKANKGKLPSKLKPLADKLDSEIRREADLEKAKNLAESNKLGDAASQYESLWRAEPRQILTGIRALRLNLQAKRYSRALSLAEEMQTWLAKQSDEKSKAYLPHIEGVRKQCKMLVVTAKALNVDSSRPSASASKKKSSSGSTPKKSRSMADEFLRGSSR